MKMIESANVEPEYTCQEWEEKEEIECCKNGLNKKKTYYITASCRLEITNSRLYKLGDLVVGINSVSKRCLEYWDEILSLKNNSVETGARLLYRKFNLLILFHDYVGNCFLDYIPIKGWFGSILENTNYKNIKSGAMIAP